MKRRRGVLLLALLCCFAAALPGQAGAAGRVVRGVVAEGACAIVGMSAEQSQLTALQRARAAAIEQAAGVAVTSGTLVTNYAVAADFIKTYARGFIVAERVTWLPLGQYQNDPSRAPIPEYRVRITADIHVPGPPPEPLGLRAALNRTVFRAGEKAELTLRTAREARVAIFNIMADDRVALIFPNQHAEDNLLSPGRDFVFPRPGGRIELEMHPLPGHRKDAEAFFVAAWHPRRDLPVRELFPAAEAMGLVEFFQRLSRIADHLEDAVLPYEVHSAR